jgi:hypothetical protein
MATFFLLFSPLRVVAPRGARSGPSEHRPVPAATIQDFRCDLICGTGCSPYGLQKAAGSNQRIPSAPRKTLHGHRAPLDLDSDGSPEAHTITFTWSSSCTTDSNGFIAVDRPILATHNATAGSLVSMVERWTRHAQAFSVLGQI